MPAVVPSTLNANSVLNLVYDSTTTDLTVAAGVGSADDFYYDPSLSALVGMNVPAMISFLAGGDSPSNTPFGAGEITFEDGGTLLSEADDGEILGNGDANILINFGNDQATDIRGQAGDDVLVNVASGPDNLFGGTGEDILIGGRDGDTIDPGSDGGETDLIALHDQMSPLTRIRDFQPGGIDILDFTDLGNFDFGAIGAGNRVVQVDVTAPGNVDLSDAQAIVLTGTPGEGQVPPVNPIDFILDPNNNYVSVPPNISGAALPVVWQFGPTGHVGWATTDPQSGKLTLDWHIDLDLMAGSSLTDFQVGDFLLAPPKVPTPVNAGETLVMPFVEGNDQLVLQAGTGAAASYDFDMTTGVISDGNTHLTLIRDNPGNVDFANDNIIFQQGEFRSAATGFAGGGEADLLVLRGGTGEVLGGGGGGDRLVDGSPGANTLRGEAGDDTLQGGAVADQLVGGAGSDLFRGALAHLDGDTIGDFGAGDAIAMTDPGDIVIMDVVVAGGVTHVEMTSNVVPVAATIHLTGDYAGRLAAVGNQIVYQEAGGGDGPGGGGPGGGGPGGGGGGGGGPAAGGSVVVKKSNLAGHVVAQETPHLSPDGDVFKDVPLKAAEGTLAAIMSNVPKGIAVEAAVPADAAVLRGQDAEIFGARVLTETFGGIEPKGGHVLPPGVFDSARDYNMAVVRPTVTEKSDAPLDLAAVSAGAQAMGLANTLPPLSALVLDTSAITAGVKVQLNALDLVILAGNSAAPHFADGGGATVLVGDSAGQTAAMGAGADRVTAGDGADIVYGNRGADLVYGNRSADVLYGGQDDDVFYGGQDADRIYGNRDADHIYGNRGADSLWGGQGDDWLHGGQDDDILWGNHGDDALIGGVGDDILWGGAGHDGFMLSAGSDWVRDFDVAFDRLVIPDTDKGITAAEVLARMSEDPDGNAMLTLNGRSITLEGVGLDALSESHVSVGMDTAQWLG